MSVNTYLCLTKRWIPYIVTAIALITLLSISVMYHQMPNANTSHNYDLEYDQLNTRLNAANHQIDALMQQNRELFKFLSEMNSLKKFSDNENKLKISFVNASNPTIDYENARRRLSTNLNELWHYLSDNKLDTKTLSFCNELRYNMLYDMKVLSQRDDRWRDQEMRNLSEFVQKKIRELQNPLNCVNAKKLVCDLNKNCGFGCQMHHLAYCLLSAMAMNRTLIVSTTTAWNDNYSDRHTNTWNELFLPLSDNCLRVEFAFNRTHWKDVPNLDQYHVIDYPIIDFIEPRPPFLPLVIPEQISQPMIALHGNPFVWFMGQLLRYIMRPSIQLKAYIEKFKKDIGFVRPIVGLHVRRTDKIGLEAESYPLSEYLRYIDDFYNKIDTINERLGKTETRVVRNIYLATDEPKVWKSEIVDYVRNGYNFIGNASNSVNAIPSRRHRFISFRDIAVDILLLSECSHIVCTFSSQVCRLAFELMQTHSQHIHSYVDHSQSYHTLDDVYYFGGQIFHGKLALVSHLAQNEDEMSFKIGDILGIANDKHNGYNFGENNRTKQSGAYQRFKVTEYIESKPFAIFD